MTAIDKSIPADPGAAVAESTNSFHQAVNDAERASRASRGDAESGNTAANTAQEALSQTRNETENKQ